MKTESISNCRLCDEKLETIDHLISGCPILAKTEYLRRHNRIAQYIHWHVCKVYHFQVSNRWYDHKTPAVMENNMAVVMWDFPIQTDRTIKANRPDIIIKDKDNKTCLMIDVSVPADVNTSLKIYEKLSKYKDLEIEIERSWKLKAKTVPIVIGALGTVNKNTEKYLDEVPGDISITEVQKQALLGTTYILRKVLSINTLH